MSDDRRTLDDIRCTVFRVLNHIQGCCPDLLPLPDTEGMTDAEVKRLARNLPHEDFRRDLDKLLDLVQKPTGDDRED